MEETNLLGNEELDVQENAFHDTRPIPIAERERKQTAKKRLFFLLLILIVIMVGLIVWEVASMLV